MLTKGLEEKSSGLFYFKTMKDTYIVVEEKNDLSTVLKDKNSNLLCVRKYQDIINILQWHLKTAWEIDYESLKWSVQDKKITFWAEYHDLEEPFTLYLIQIVKP